MEEHRHGGVATEPPSTAISKLKEYIEPLLNLTLTLSIEESINIGLSKQFCSNLLKNDDESSSIYIDDLDLGGVPKYPLYKCLASSLWKSIARGAVNKMNDDMSLSNEDFSLKDREFVWNKVIMEKGSELIKMLETVEFELHVQEPFFTQLKDGKKTIEGRCAGGDYNRIETGSLILFNKRLLLQVQDVHPYASFPDMLKAEGLAKVLPGVETVEEGTQIYRKFYSEEKERSKGVLAVHIIKPTLQLYDHLATILAALHYDGIQRLLGISHTVGTVPDALPLPRSSLLSAFTTPHNPDV